VAEERPWFDVGLTGKGQVVAVSDSGLDVYNCYFWDRSGPVPMNGSVDSSKRKVVQYDTIADTTDDYRGHGTHVCGTVAGKRSDDGTNEKNWCS